MVRFETIFISFITFLCAIYTFFSAQMKMGTIDKPGPGFVPVIIGSVGLVVSVILLISCLRKGEKAKSEKMDREGLIRFLGYLVASILFIPMFMYLGAIITIFVLILVLTKISGSKGWAHPIIFALVCSFVFYVIFDIVLDVSLPQGIVSYLGV